MTWGPQAQGGPTAPVLQRLGGAWMWLLPLGWIATLPAWAIWFMFASIAPTDVLATCPPDEFGVAHSGDCPAAREIVGQQLTTFAAVLAVAWLIAIALSLLIGFVQGRRRRGILYGRTFLIIFSVLVAAIPLIGYLAGYGLGRLSTGARLRRKRTPPPPPTQAEIIRDSPDPLGTITEIITRRTEKLPGAVLGWSLDGTDSIVTAPPRGGVLVLGPPGSGKTSAVLIPTVLLAPGACVSSSIKSDVMNATAAVRAQKGRVWHFDPGGDEVTPAGVEHVRWSPLVSVRSWDDALQVGKTMAEPLRKGDRGSGDTHFVGRATDWVQTLLYAAYLDGRPIADVAQWAMAASDEQAQTEVLEILTRAQNAGDEGARIASQKLLGLISTPDRERGSIISTMVALLRVYDSVNARTIGVDPNFDPREFVRSTDTLYITARPDKQELYAPLLAALLEQIRFETYDRTKHEQAGLEPAHPHVTFALDEANTTAPIPLPAIISEAGGQGLHIVVGIQALGPAIARWGDAARSFLTLFPTKVIFRGVFDKDTVSALASAAGEYDRHVTSYGISTSYVGKFLIPLQTVNPTYSIDRRAVLTEGDITSIPEGRALVWDGPAWGLLAIGYHWKAGVWQAAFNAAPVSPAIERAI